ncbi:membrane protein insertion efficiency factor YidD [Aureimonas fodinaquatilis]|uniref:Putative membrane protein insertion efficiency factor n=1 Tax=Aureimonas fodinaquatilis TaxID=2565783 RepID=A0A5B0DZJ5_9HYPH|nr:membrane protein insertion efficiency factor YidD [Aureimonas fodinaquatilis]KAA0970639.1 membrane protein insertion efficiency factor YidD [Aureimonas fodinaquatilis]
MGDQRLNRNYTGRFPRTPARIFGLAAVRLYQITLSPLIGGHCRHIPTCSEYAYEAIARHGLWRGGWLSARRVARCGPFGKAGLDPVPHTCGRHDKEPHA